MSNKSNLLILGAYGQENIGDEALLKSTLDNLDRNKFKDIFVNSMDPEKTSKLFDVKGFYTGFIHTIIPFLKSKMIIYGGGTILVELRMTPYIKSLPLIRSFLINFFARLLGKKVFYLGIGAEEVNSKLSKWLIKNCIHFCTKCFVRDQKSLNLLLPYANKDKKVILTSDLVFALPPILKAHEVKNTLPKILILPLYRIIDFESSYANYIESIKDFTKKASTQKFDIEFFPMRVHHEDQHNDKVILETLQKELHGISKFNYDSYSISEFINYISKFDLIISSRFHGLVFGLIQNIPVISLSEFDKNTSLMTLFDLKKYSLKGSELTGNQILYLSNEILNPTQYSKLKNSIQKNTYKFLINQN